MGMSTGGGADEPMMDINMTPLIDVLLVLLVMFIITIPVMTHAVKLDMPRPDPNQLEPPAPPVIRNLESRFDGNPVLARGPHRQHRELRVRVVVGAGHGRAGLAARADQEVGVRRDLGVQLPGLHVGGLHRPEPALVVGVDGGAALVRPPAHVRLPDEETHREHLDEGHVGMHDPPQLLRHRTQLLTHGCLDVAQSRSQDCRRARG